MVLLDLLMLTTSIVVIVDLSGIISSIKWLIGKYLNIKDYNSIKLKPLECSFCMTFWIGLLYLLITGNITLANFMFVNLAAVSTNLIKNIILTISDILIKITNTINRL